MRIPLLHKKVNVDCVTLPNGNGLLLCSEGKPACFKGTSVITAVMTLCSYITYAYIEFDI